MQLIVESETTLDIEINMSTVENVQNNKNENLKIVNLNIEHHHDKKCNGNEQDSDFKEDSESEERTDIVNEVDKTDISLNIDNEAESTKVNLSEVINENNYSVETKDTQLEESQKELLQNDIEDSGSVENKTISINESSDTLEEDYLEDDIISIVEEPFKEVPISETTLQSIASEKHENIITENTQVFAEDKLKIQDDKKESLQIGINSLIDPDDTVKVIEETDSNHVQCLKDAELQTLKRTEDIHDTDNLELLPIEGELQTQLTVQNENGEISVTKVDDLNVSTEILQSLKENDDIEQIHETDGFALQLEKDPVSVPNTENNEEINITPTENSSIIGDDSVQSQIEQSKQGHIKIPEEVEKTALETENDFSAEINTVKETEEESIQSNNTIDAVIEEGNASKCQNTDTPDSPSNENHEVMEEPKETCLHDENKRDFCVELDTTDNIDTAIEDGNIEKTSEIQSQSLKVSNTNVIDTTIATDVHDMDVDEITKDPKIASNMNNSTIELDLHKDGDQVLENKSQNKDDTQVNGSSPVCTAPANIIDQPIICKLSNTLDILSDEEELPEINIEKVKSSKIDPTKTSKDANNKQSINIEEDDDDIMVIDEDTNKIESPADPTINKETVVQTDVNTDSETGEKTVQESTDLFDSQDKKETTPPPAATKDLNIEIDVKDKASEPAIPKNETPPPLIPDNFVTTAKKKLSDMTRDELEEFCILKIVESIVDRSSLSDIKNKLKSMSQGLEEYRRKAMMLTKQNRDLQVVLKSVQEEQKKVMGSSPITPLKITRSVGMQVFMEKTVPRKKGPQQAIHNKNLNSAQNKNAIPLGQGPRQQKQLNQSIPVPRLVPANSPALKSPSAVPQINPMNSPAKNVNPPNGMLKTPSPVIKAEKRQFNKIASSVTVDLTDDEPPTKMSTGPRTSPAPPVRLVPPQNLMGPQRQPFGSNVNSPRKVYIPISGPQNQTLRPGQTIMLKTVPATGIRPRCPTPQITRVDPNAVRMNRIAPRHPAPLPLTMKQYQPPNWKPLPPAPDLKLSKVENGIVISWKIEDVPEDSYEEIASYQLYAYQETSQPPCTSLWKKIGDVKALPLPMACTLTQFMAGFKYYFAVRAIDVRSRIGPFSLPGSILLLSKNI